ncbi:uncharacterized protein [Diabrotica undecimpunctata]|uniref:uncharacterized protein isoform X1 n=1 Tax=Diabrotica undecimpunctata TaxID=50387 RepID=UPI003B63F795
MVQKKVWAASNDGAIEYISLTSEYLEDALDVLRQSFYRYEAGCFAVGLSEDLEAMAEMDSYMIDVAKGGISVVAVEKATNIVCGVAFNKIQIDQGPSGNNYYKNYMNMFKRTATKEIFKFMDTCDELMDVFTPFNVSSVMEIMFLATSPDFTKRGIALQLCEASTELAKALKMKQNVKQSLDGRVLPLEPTPQAMCALFTSPYSQKIGRKMGWTIVDKISFDKFYTKGKPFSSVLGNYVKYITVECKKI